MIEARDFVEAARGCGMDWYAGVPCSFLTPFINYVIDDPSLAYVSATNEGDAVAAAAGAAVGGRGAVAMMQNSGLGNAVSPLTSLTWVFRIPVLIICTHRGAPDAADEPQHELMGRITPGLLETMELPCEPFPSEAGAIEATLARAGAHFAGAGRPFALLMRKGTVAPHALRGAAGPPAPAGHAAVERLERPGAHPRATRREALERLRGAVDPARTVIVATTGFTGRELYALGDRSNQLYMVGSMGCASAFGLGLAMARPDLDVVVVDGDGAALMRLGNLATIGAYGAGNLVHLLLDNEAHDSTGAQATVSAGVDFPAIARACGYATVLGGDDPALVEALLAAPRGARPRFGHLKIATGTLGALPRPGVAPADVVRRLMAHIGTRFAA